MKDLEERRLLIRTHGSASPVSSLTIDRHIDEKEKVQVNEKTGLRRQQAGCWRRMTGSSSHPEQRFWPLPGR
ncbi:MAG: hypothetical protein MZV63_38615 [Marinilabiliales bacterium]|nr:hypothetical protein [Marinilabiliales bacterium]